MEDHDLEQGKPDIIGHTFQLLLDCEKKGENRKKKFQPFIYMVPDAVRRLSPDSFNPRLVSIGPLHKDDKYLQEFEEQKETYLHELLGGLKSSAEETLKACVQKVSGSIDKIKVCYAGISNIDDVELAKMMVMDGCFIIYFLYMASVKLLTISTLITPYIINDLLLIENQIPYFVLKDIFECTKFKLGTLTSLDNLIFQFIKRTYMFEQDPKIENHVIDSCNDHILGILHKFYKVNYNDDKSEYRNDGHSAIELHRAGLSFKPNKDTLAMKFELYRFSGYPWSWYKPTLEMPVLIIDDSTELVFRNLIVYEQSSSSVPNYVTSYTSAMDQLIDSPEDVAKLVDSKVLVNDTGSNEKAANMMNNICKDITITHFFYEEEWQKLDKYYSSYWPKNIAGLKRKYFNNPWSMIALFAGIFLFTLTLIQTIFTVNVSN